MQCGIGIGIGESVLPSVSNNGNYLHGGGGGGVCLHWTISLFGLK